MPCGTPHSGASNKAHKTLETKMKDPFDLAAANFTSDMEVAANWKQIYSGATYSTRLRAAIAEVRLACDRMEKALKEDAYRRAPVRVNIDDMDPLKEAQRSHASQGFPKKDTY